MKCSVMTKEQTKTKVIRGRIHKLAWNEQGNMSFLITNKWVFSQLIEISMKEKQLAWNK